MKDQYFGDINDYRKYGLLRILARPGRTTGVCWMLTPDDDSRDGGKVQYLGDPDRWRHFDPPLFDCLRECLRVDPCRATRHPLLRTVLSDTHFFAEVLTDRRDERRPYFERMLAAFRGAGLVFFDPDNGLEVASVPPGRKRSSKYLYWDEVAAAFRAGHSLLVYQHFSREEHPGFVARRAAETRERTGAAEVFWFATSQVVYFLAAQPLHVAHYAWQARRLAETWAPQFAVGTGRGGA